MDNIDVICIGAAIVDIPLQPVSKNTVSYTHLMIPAVAGPVSTNR